MLVIILIKYSDLENKKIFKKTNKIELSCSAVADFLVAIWQEFDETLTKK